MNHELSSINSDMRSQMSKSSADQASRSTDAELQLPVHEMQSWKAGESSEEKIFFHSNFYRLFTSFQLWKTSQPNDFTFADPLMRETPTEYNSLHDPNLRTFFMRKTHLDVSGICITNQPSKSLHLRSILILSLNSICVETTSSRIVTRSFAR